MVFFSTSPTRSATAFHERSLSTRHAVTCQHPNNPKQRQKRYRPKPSGGQATNRERPSSRAPLHSQLPINRFRPLPSKLRYTQFSPSSRNPRTHRCFCSPMAKTTQPTAGARDPLLPTSGAAVASPPPYLDPHPADSYTVLLVPVRLRHRLRRGSGRCCGVGPCLTALFLLLALAGFLLWPADPDVSLARLRLAHVSVVARPAVAVTISAALKVRVRNPDFFALDYNRLDVAIAYRGAPLGRVTSGGGRVRARAVSYVDADLQLDGIRVVEDAIYLVEDLARGSVPFDTIVEVEGHLHFFFLSIPVKE
ncbi:hypothetical protein BDA96_01G133400 [Sorghum bicolor]|uniref:Late embryogenesis abundant protein LEA-2 subgroup domain-containing protein n=2 Tax=Sorghum bicolor TaxID=4558 RepID=A0A921UY17_SORBI|nr:hypothetical protein BDA96_01G133400 [Sorghum bicolor]